MRIGTKLLGGTLGIVLIGTLISSWWTTRIAEKSLTDALIGQLTAMTSAGRSEFQDHLELFEYGLEAASETQITANILNAPDNAPARERAEIMLAGVQKNLDDKIVRWVVVLDKDGKAVASSHKEIQPGRSFADRDFFRQALEGKKVVGTPELDRTSGAPVFMMAVPVRELGSNTIHGVVCLSVDVKVMGEHILGELQLGKLGYGYLAMRPGTTIYHPDPKRYFDDTTQYAWSKEIMRMRTGWLNYEFGGTERLAVFSEMSGTEWVVVLVVDQSEALAAVSQLQKAGWISTAVMLVVVGLIIFIIVRGITMALGRAVNFAQTIAAGDLSKDMHSVRRDELGTLGRALQAMLVQLREMIAMSESKTRDAEASTAQANSALAEAEQARLKADSARREGLLEAATRLEVIVGRLASASEQLSAQVTQATRGADVQRERLAGTASAMEEMNATVLEVARSAAQSASISEQAKKQAENGATQVQDVVSGMRQVNANTRAVGERLHELDQQAAGIGEIMGMISDIADQTNLLALNAAIEAARAGDAGRGFAVVADEVRKLAEKTMSATRQVGDAVQAIQKGTNEVVHAMEDTTKAVESTTELAGNAGVVLTEIVTIVNGSTDHARAIAAASEEQSATSEEIRHGTEEINMIASETARAMDESSQAVGELAQLAQQLAELVDQLKRG